MTTLSAQQMPVQIAAHDCFPPEVTRSPIGPPCQMLLSVRIGAKHQKADITGSRFFSEGAYHFQITGVLISTLNFNFGGSGRWCN